MKMKRLLSALLALCIVLACASVTVTAADLTGGDTDTAIPPCKQIPCGYTEHLVFTNDDPIYYTFVPETSGMYFLYTTNIDVAPDEFLLPPSMYIYLDDERVEHETWFYGYYSCEHRGVVCEMEAGNCYVLKIYGATGKEVDLFFDKVSEPDEITIVGDVTILKGAGASFDINATAGFPFISGETVWTFSDDSILNLEDYYTHGAYVTAMNYGTVTITATLENGLRASLDVTVVDTLKGQCGDDVAYKLTDDGTLVLSGTGPTWDYSHEISGEWWGNYPEVPWYHGSVKTIIVEPGITKIGNALFNSCNNLTSVTLPEGLTSIGARAFFGCDTLNTITIPKDVAYMGMGSLDACDNLSFIYFTGDAPVSHISFGSRYHDEYVYYPAGNPTWTAEVIKEMSYKDYATWIAYDPCETDHAYKSVVTEPTCTEQGYTTHTCTVCSHRFVDGHRDALGHDYEAVVTKPTTTSKGYTTMTCRVCGFWYTINYVDPLIAYNVGNGQENIDWGSSSEDAVTIHVDADVEKFVQVTVNGDVLDPSCYTVTEGSTIVTLKAEYLASLPDGDYTVTVEFTDGIATSTVHVTGNDTLLGDVDGSGEIDTTDAYLIVMYYNEKMNLDEAQLLAADVDGSGEADTTDAYYIVMYYNEKIDAFPARQ